MPKPEKSLKMPHAVLEDGSPTSQVHVVLGSFSPTVRHAIEMAFLTYGIMIVKA
jgi:hypothetical protein